MTEFDLIDWIRCKATTSAALRVGIGDDCAMLELPNNNCLITTDSVIENVHFDSNATPKQVGHKAMARSLSDIAAMAGMPVAVVVACMLPRNYPAGNAQQMFLGMQELASKFDVVIAGGDIASGVQQVSVCVTAIGVPIGKPILRSGAKVGDRIYVTGKLGGSILGRHLSFLPRIREAQQLAKQYELNAMIDVSDGLAADLGHIVEESRCGAVLSAERIPISDDAVRLSQKDGDAPLHHALTDGEDYELVFTVPAGSPKIDSVDGLPVAEIGHIVAENGLWLERGGKRIALAAEGWKHRLDEKQG